MAARLSILIKHALRTNIMKQTYRQPYTHKPTGFSIIEFLVASALSMIVLVAVGSGYFAARKVNDAAGGRLETQQDIRNAANMIVRDSKMAGSFGCFNMSNASTIVTQNASAAANVATGLSITSGSNTFSEGVKSVAQANFNSIGITDFTASSDALIYQYGVGSPQVSALATGTTGSVTINTSNDNESAAFVDNSPIIVSSCNVLDQVNIGSLSGTATAKALNGLNLNASHNQAELSVMRYLVNVYVVGTPTGGDLGFYRFQLGPDGSWQGPQLLVKEVNNMSVLYGYVNGCPGVDTTVASSALETFTFFNSLQATDAARPLAMIRLILNGNSIAATGKTKTASGTGTVNESAGNVYVYNIDANIRGGNRCADRSR